MRERRGVHGKKKKKKTETKLWKINEKFGGKRKGQHGSPRERKCKEKGRDNKGKCQSVVRESQNLLRTFSSGFSCHLDKNNIRTVVEAKVQLRYFKEGIRS